MPSHSISSFGILHRIHLVLSRRLWDDPENPLQSGEAFLHTLQNAVNQCGAEAPISSCVLTGEYMIGQLPSIHLLRLAFLYAASMCEGFPYVHRAVLSCAENYMNNFGICGLPPLLSIFMKLVNQQTQSDSLTREERDRWKQTEKAIESVWTKTTRNYESGTGIQDIHSTHYPQQPNTAFEPGSHVQSQQSSTTALFHPNTNMNHSSTSMGILFTPDPNAKMLELANHHQPLPQVEEALHLNGQSAVVGEFEDMDTLTISPSMPHPGVRQPSFSSAALDYDTILDDIASIERTSMPESETQFMANLGLRPGTNLADVFSHEFTGFLK
ncbi:hypothetical protein E0Z10_g3660 [Xylaria hypoxylon]|uniref:Transcription factor domain-containing protein n=1 Tax=Xylaria hypoxylon TaxID=37992 RepID=A0A4Z0YLI2_9PEZI|nr:hypothetical protein E0Z10_g3660 [Xylaria hypoxylon]